MVAEFKLWIAWTDWHVFCASVQNGGIYVDFHEGSGDDSMYEDVYDGFDASGGYLWIAVSQ